MVLLARKDEEGNTQTLYDHLHGAGRLASGFEDEFADISRTAAVLHDVGKVAQQFQTYLLSDDGHRGDVQHARQGAFVVNDFFESKGEIEEIAKEILELAISKHHGGLPDCIDESGNRAFLLGFTESDKSNEKYAYQEIKRGLNGLALDLQSNFRGSAEDIACFLKKIKSLGMSKDSIYFYLGLLVKLIYSRLVDADRTDAACFETRKQYRPNTVDWQNLISRLDKSMRSFDSSSEINRIRHQINEQCCLAGARETGIYRLSIPTGGGKTLASLNFALHHALKTGKHRIIYVIPYSRRSPIRRGAHCGSSLCHTLNRQTVVPGSVMRSMTLWLCLRKVILKIIRRFRQCFFWDIHVSGEHLSVKRKRFLKKIIATTDFCNYQSRFIAYK